MTRAQTARLLVGIAGTGATGLSTYYVHGTGWIIATIVVGFVASSILAERAFHALADADVHRRDLEERVRAED